MALIETKGITKIYKEKTGVSTQALRGINLVINPADFVAIAGPSGSGKTTLLNLLGALDKPTSGNIIFEGVEITNIPVTDLADFRLKKIGFVFQAYNLFNQLTALENVEYVMLLQGIAVKTRREKANELLESVGLADCSSKRPNQLSGGQQQRVAVVRALASNPQVILADEPTANLDSETAGNLIDFIRNLNRQHKTTFIFSTHDRLVMDKADKVFLLKDGKIIE